MNSNIVQVQKSELIFNDSQVRLLKSTILDEQTTNDELALFSLVCGRTGLDPFARQVYGIRRKGKLTFQTSIDGYRLIADRTRKYAGSDDAIFDEGLNLYQHLQSGRDRPIVATVTVWKLVENVRCPFTASASWNQYSQNFKGQLAETWAKMPHLMLAKCAESLALRKAFPAELSGIYTSEEFPAENDSFRDSVSTVSVNAKPLVSKRPALSAAALHETPKVLWPGDTIVDTEISEKLARLRWSQMHVQNCLAANFNKVNPAELEDDQRLDVVDYLDLFEKTSTEIQRLKWTAEQGKAILKMHFGVETRNNLNLQQLAKFYDFLKTQQPA